MIRDLEVIRYILLELEKTDAYYVNMEDLATVTYPVKVISHHINLLRDCGFIEAEASGIIGYEYDLFLVKRITSAGYDYLDSVRDNNIWNETKKQLTTIGSSASLDVVKAISNKIILGLLGI